MQGLCLVRALDRLARRPRALRTLRQVLASSFFASPRIGMRVAPFAQGVDNMGRSFVIALVPTREVEDGFGAKNGPDRLLLVRSVVKWGKDRNVSRQTESFRDRDEFVREKISRADQLHVPAFVEQSEYHQFRDPRPSPEPHGSRGMTESKRALLLRAASTICLGTSRPQSGALIDGALDDSGGDGRV